MTLHPDISFQELVEYCQLCREYGDMVKSVKVDRPTLARIKQVSRFVTSANVFLGVRFYVPRNAEKMKL